MRKYHVVRDGYFVVDVSKTSTLVGRSRVFKSYENAYRYFRYHVAFLGWMYGSLQYVSMSRPDIITLAFVDREVELELVEGV